MQRSSCDGAKRIGRPGRKQGIGRKEAWRTANGECMGVSNERSSLGCFKNVLQMKGLEN